MSITVAQSDFIGVGQVATHCDLPKLNIAIEEAILFDLEPVLGNLFGAVDENWTQAAGPYKDIISPKAYENCAGFNTTHQGLRKVVVYFAYARYIMINPFDDTPNGQVSKTNDWSIPTPLADKKAFSSKYKNMATVAMEKVEAYILKNSADYDGYNLCNLKGCGCNGSCGSKTNTRGFGLSSKTIRK